MRPLDVRGDRWVVVAADMILLGRMLRKMIDTSISQAGFVESEAFMTVGQTTLRLESAEGAVGQPRQRQHFRLAGVGRGEGVFSAKGDMTKHDTRRKSGTRVKSKLLTLSSARMTMARSEVCVRYQNIVAARVLVGKGKRGGSAFKGPRQTTSFARNRF